MWNSNAGFGWPATASLQPPAYQAQDTPAASRRSPMCGIVWMGTRWSAGTLLANGVIIGWAVFTTKPSGRTALSSMNPGASGIGAAIRSAGAFGQTGAQAQ